MFGLTAVEFFVAVVVIFIVTYWITPRKLAWLPMLLTSVLLGVLAFNAVPNETDDLSRYFQILTQLKDGGHDLLEKWYEEKFMEWDTYRVCAYYFYYISKLSSVCYLPAITIFLVYGLSFLVIYKAAMKFDVEKSYLFIGSMFFISTYWYYDTYSGIRNGLTFAIITACAYYHLVERKRIPLCIAGYLIACFLHSTGAMYVVLVFVAVLTLNNKGKFMNFALIFGMTAGQALIQYLATHTEVSLFKSIAGRAETVDGESVIFSTSFATNVVTVIVVAVIVFYFGKYVNDEKPSVYFKRYYKYASIMEYFMIGCLFSALVFVRFARWVIPVIGAVVYMVGNQLQQEYFNSMDTKYILYFSPPSITRRYKFKGLLNLVVVVYTLVHFWYLCTGSSLCWIHF